MAYEHISLTGRISDRVEMCCNQCGNFTQILNTNNLTHDELIRREHNFRCDKCINISGNNMGSTQKSDLIHKTNSGDNKKVKRIHDNGQDYHDDIIVSNGGGGRSGGGGDGDADGDGDGDVDGDGDGDGDIEDIVDDDDEEEEDVEDDDAHIGIDDDMDDDIIHEQEHDVDLINDDDDDDDIDNGGNKSNHKISSLPSSRLPKISKISPASTTTILKDNNTKPILKFSVSAILGDTREGVRVRNGKKKL
uniref:Uncharacterized protein n=1 Tax=Glossina morsitans morsitans TaxID=37546 RepID=A0A1B0FBZ1_GLOMM